MMNEIRCHNPWITDWSGTVISYLTTVFQTVKARRIGTGKEGFSFWYCDSLFNYVCQTQNFTGSEQGLLADFGDISKASLGWSYQT